MLIPYDTSSSRESLKIRMSINFGHRMAEARELCALSQMQAAALLGYKTSSALCKIELGDYGTFNAPHIIPLAALTYQCSADYLLGLSGYPTRNVPEARQSQIQELLADCLAGEREAIRKMAAALDEVTSLVLLFEQKTADIAQTLIRFRKLNPEFEEMPNGAKLDRLIHELRQDAKRNAGKLSAVRETLNPPVAAHNTQ
ncbi:MAG: hypothetical protein KGZ69_12450 [Methylomonas sp.]|nr:hypothetical protein [Methylomonas sp.]